MWQKFVLLTHSMLAATMFLAMLSRTELPVSLLLRANRLLLSSLALAYITTDMAVNYRPALVRMAHTAKARVLADVGTTTVTPAMPEPMWIPFPARDS
nr:MAG TPA: hypothetical protein [Caudoviricetes sp.]